MFKINFIYKTSFEKANRSSVNGYRGPGFSEGLRILRKVREELGRYGVKCDIELRKTYTDQTKTYKTNLLGLESGCDKQFPIDPVKHQNPHRIISHGAAIV